MPSKPGVAGSIPSFFQSESDTSGCRYECGVVKLSYGFKN